MRQPAMYCFWSLCLWK